MVALPTGLGEARNALVVRAADAVVAVGGGWGTLSEIALALKTGVPVVGVGDVGAGAAAARRWTASCAQTARGRRSRGGACRGFFTVPRATCNERVLIRDAAAPYGRGMPEIPPRQLAACGSPPSR